MKIATRSNLIYSIVLFWTALFLFVLLAGRTPKIADDAFITLTYAQNLVDFGALRWHIDLPPVEGFTSIAHVLLLWVGGTLGMDLVAWNSLLQLLAVGVLLTLFIVRTKSLSISSRALGLTALVLSADAQFWLSGGLDTLMYVAAIFWSYTELERAWLSKSIPLSAGASLMVISLIRPEGMIVAAFATIFLVLAKVSSGARGGAMYGVALVMVGMAGLLAWRMTEFGYPIPNTFYAKESASRILEISAGLSYLKSWIVKGSGGLLAFSALAAMIIPGAWFRFLFVSGLILIAVVEGGDPHPGYRFLLPVLPLIALDIAELTDRLRNTVFVVVVTLALFTLPMRSQGNGYSVTVGSFSTSVKNISNGNWPILQIEDDDWSHLKAQASEEFASLIVPDTPVAANDVGAFAFFSKLPVIDFLGLNHPVISHLEKPAHVKNLWGNARLDFAIEQGVNVVYLWFPRFDDWTFDDVANGASMCKKGAHRVAQLTGYALNDLSQAFDCVSVPSESREGKWHNFFVRSGQLDNALSNPSSANISKCLPDFRQACGL